MKKNITILDIAKQSGVSKTTVSRAVNGNGYVGEETLAKVERVIAKNNYSPSAMARNLSRGESETIGVIIPEADNPFFGEVLAGISQVIDENKFVLMFCNTDNSPLKDERAIYMMSKHRVRGLIFTPAVDYSDSQRGGEIVGLLKSLKAPVVVVDRPLPNFDFDGVYSDNFGGAYVATESLIKNGHKKIGIVAGDLNLYIGRQRLLGYKKAMEDNNLAVQERDIIDGGFNAIRTYELTVKFLSSGDLPSAFFVCNNLSAAGFLKAAFEAGVKIPQDIEFIGFDKTDGADTFGLSYSYLDRDVLSIGIDAANLLLDRIKHPRKKRVQIFKPLRLIEREA